jgi:hypothetical protein
VTNFITKRKHLRELIFSTKTKLNNKNFFNILLDFVLLLIKTNEYEDTIENKPLIDTLKTVTYIKNSETNNHILLYHKKTQKYIYLNENLFNLCIYLIVKCSFINETDQIKYETLVEILFQDSTTEYINCQSLKSVLSDLNKYELLHCSQNLSHIYTFYITKQLSLNEILTSIHAYYGLPTHIIELLLIKIDINEENLNLNDFKNLCSSLNLKSNALIQILKLYAEDIGYDFKSRNKYLNYLIVSNDESSRNDFKEIKTFYLNIDESKSEIMDVDQFTAASLDDDLVLKEQNILCDNILRLFEQKQHEQLIIKTKNLKLNNELNTNSQLISQLNHLTAQIPNNLQTLNDKLVYLVDLLYEMICKTSLNNLENLIKNFFFYTNNSLINSERILIIIKFIIKYEHKFEKNLSLIEMFIDLYVKLDKQIINKQIDFEKDELVFGKRFVSTKLQTFLILLLTHQATWTILHDCVHRLLDRSKKKFLKLNSKIVLDFLWSLIHIPTLWRGMDSVSTLDLYKEESILDLDDNELYCLIDLICDEILYEKKNCDKNEIKYLFKKRVQLLTHFLNNSNSKCLVGKLSLYLQLDIDDIVNNGVFDLNDFNE